MVNQRRLVIFATATELVYREVVIQYTAIVCGDGLAYGLLEWMYNLYNLNLIFTV